MQVEVLPPRAMAIAAHADCRYQQHMLKNALAWRPHVAVMPRPHSGAVVSDEQVEAALEASVHSGHVSAVLDEYEVLPWGVVLGPPHVLCNAICVRKGLTRKANLAKHITGLDYLPQHDSAAARLHTPASIVIDTWSIANPDPMIGRAAAISEALFEAEEAMASAPPSTAWILKPSLANRAVGIQVVTSFEQVKALVLDDLDAVQWVLQRYVGPPATALGGHKFHLRVYMALIGTTRVCIYSEGLALFAPARWKPGEAGGSAAHLTNTCANSGYAGFAEDQFVRTISELPALLAQDCAKWLPSADQQAACAETFRRTTWAAVRRVCASLVHTMQGQWALLQPLQNAYELFGVDFAVDAAGKPWLLEVNPGPDLKQTGTRLNGFMDRMLHDLLSITLDCWDAPAQKFAEPRQLVAGLPSGAASPQVEVDGITRTCTVPTAWSWRAPQHVSGNGWDVVYAERWHVPKSSQRVHG